MQSIVEDNTSQIKDLCIRFHVMRLYAFGSVLRDDFDVENSDVDFLVTFDDSAKENYADCFFGLSHSLEDLIKRPVELVVESAINNPYFQQKIEQNKILIYEA